MDDKLHNSGFGGRPFATDGKGRVLAVDDELNLLVHKPEKDSRTPDPLHRYVEDGTLSEDSDHSYGSTLKEI